MKFFIEDKEDLINSVSLQLKSMGVKVPKVKKMKTNISKQGRGQFQAKSKVFGACLNAQDAAFNCNNLPKFILSCTDYLQKFSKEIGLFRKAGSLARQKNLRMKIENGGNFDGSEPNDVASLLKQWLRELPEPLIPFYLHDSFIRCQHLNDRDHTIAILLICLFLPPIHLYTLKHLMSFLADVSTNVKQNKMDVDNLAMIMAPNIFLMGTNTIDKTSSNKVQQYTLVTRLLIKNADRIGEVPPALSNQLPPLARTCEYESNLPCDTIEASPSLSRKNYLLRSIKKLVKQNSTPLTSQMAESGSCAPSMRTDLKQPTLESNGMEVTVKATTETKGNGFLFPTRSSEDICKRSFGLLRKKEKKKLKAYHDCSPLTQSLGIESSFDFPIEIDEETVDSTIQGKRDLLKSKSNSRSVFSLSQIDEKISDLEGIEMATFKTQFIDQNESIQAFPIPFTSPTFVKTELETSLHNLPTGDKDKLQQDILETKNLAKDEIPTITEIQSSTSTLNLSLSNVSYSKNKPIKPFLNPCSPQTLQLFTGEYKSMSPTNIEEKICGPIVRGTFSIPSQEVEDVTNIDSGTVQLGGTEFSNKGLSSEDLGISPMRIRQYTFIVSPEESYSSKMKVLNQKGNGIKACNDLCTTSEAYKDPLQKKQCIASGVQSRVRRKNVLHEARKAYEAKKIYEARKTHDSLEKIKGSKSKFPVQKSTLRKVRNGKVSKASSKSNNIKTHNERDALQNQPAIDKVEFKNVIFPIFSTEENQSCIVPSTSTSKHNEFSEANNPQMKTSFEDIQRSSKRKSISTPPRISNSKIPRLVNSFEVAHSKCFSEPSSSHLQKRCKTTDSSALPTRIPVKCDNKNLSSLQLSINDSCFQTPNRNAMLSPNSVVWMSGNKYFVSSSPQEEQFNKRESIAMILKSNPGHVQAKVHLYDDLIRENVESTESSPSHSTPTSKFSKRLSSSSQSLKFTPKHKTNLQSSKSISYSKSTVVSRGYSIQNKEKNPKQTHDATKYKTSLNMPSPIRSCSLKDVTNKSIGLNASKNSLTKGRNSSVFVDKNTSASMQKKQRLKRNSFSGNTSSKPLKKVSRSESTPGTRPSYHRVSSLKQDYAR